MDAVRDRMTRRVVTATLETRVGDVVKLLKQHDIRHLPVVEEGQRLIGLITHRDLIGGALGPLTWVTDDELESALSEMTTGELMTADVITTTPDALLSDAAETLLREHVGCLPVVEGDILVGMLTESDFVAHVAGRPPRPIADAG